MEHAQTSEVAGLARLNGIADSFRPYQPSGLARTADGRAYLLARNETPFQPLASVVSAISGAAAEVNRYPDPACTDLRAELAQRFDLPEDHITVGAGSVTFIQALFAATIEPGASIVYPWRSFELYSVLADLAGFSSVRVPLTSDRHDLDAMAAAVDDRTRLVMICNPNNPTSTAVSPDDLDRFLGSLPPTCVVLLDEAYGEYSRHPGLGVSLSAIVAQPDRHPDFLQGLRTGWPPDRLHVRAPLRRRPAAQGMPSLFPECRGPGGGAGRPEGPGPAARAGRRDGRRAHPVSARRCSPRAGRCSAANELPVAGLGPGVGCLRPELR